MFDVGFSEIVVIAVVALIVIGPQKLPKTARTLGHLFGRLQRYVNEVKADINREIELDELRKLQQEVQTAAKSIETSVTSVAREVETGVRSVETELNAAAQGVESPAASPEMLPLAHAAAVVAPVAPPSAAEQAAVPAREPPRQASLPGFERGYSAAMSDTPPPDATQETFISHLVALRDRLLRSIIAVVVTMVCLFPWAKDIYALLAAPLLKAQIGRAHV